MIISSEMAYVHNVYRALCCSFSLRISLRRHCYWHLISTVVLHGHWSWSDCRGDTGRTRTFHPLHWWHGTTTCHSSTSSGRVSSLTNDKHTHSCW